MDKKLEKMTIDYHTYKNKLLETYPESVIDIQLVFEEDTFNFKKENGVNISIDKYKIMC